MLKNKKLYSIVFNCVNFPKICRAKLRPYSTYREAEDFQGQTVDLAYASYETTISKSEGRPPLVILHCLLESKKNWANISDAIHKTTRRKLITIDARNHGDSPHTSEHTYRHMAEDVIGLMQKLNIPKYSILGHSMGGRTAMLISLMKPEVVSSLIVEDISPLRTSPKIYAMKSHFDAMCLIKIPQGVTLSQARYLADEQLATTVTNLELRYFITSNIVETKNKEYGWKINLKVIKDNFTNNIAAFPMEGAKFKYCGPTLFICGSFSDHIGYADLPGIRSLFPSAKLKCIDGAGHWAHRQTPEPFLKATCDFITTHT